MIGPFIDEFRWLSNFWSVWIEYRGNGYATVEHAFQAAKTTNENDRSWISSAPTAGSAKRRGSKDGEKGRKIVIRPDWESIKIDVMTDLVRIKFQNPELRAKLLATGEQDLVEINWWGDKFWGVVDESKAPKNREKVHFSCVGVGANHLGIILKKIRQKIRDELA